jgi:hypothetical protein
MHVIAILGGLALVLLVLLDSFEALVLPRRVTHAYRLARLFYRTTWSAWAAAACLFRGRSRQSFLSVYGPLSLLLLLGLWAAGLVTGFALLQWGFEAPLQPLDLGSCFYLSGVTLFTVGYGDVVPVGGVGKLLAVVEAGMGLGFLAVVISYLPVLSQAFSRREVTISMLDARAGSPPSAGAFLLRLARGGGVASLDDLLAEWERWAAELLESHMSFPVLSYYRSQHDNQSWLAALATALDACALVLVGVEGVPPYQAQLTFAMARHAAVDLALVFRTPPRPPAADRLPPERLTLLRRLLHEAGLTLRDGPTAEAKLTRLRALYEPFLASLADHFHLLLPAIFPEQPGVDNWQTSAWTRRSPGLSDLHAPDPADDHFD